MRKAFCLCFGFFCIFILATPRIVKYENYYTGNAKEQYSPPSGCALYIIPNSNKTGTITEKISGRIETTISIVISSDNKISWSSNFPVRAIIVQSPQGYYLQEYVQEPMKGEFTPSGIDDLNYVAVVYREPESTPAETTMTPTGSAQTPAPSVVPSPTDEIPVTADSSIVFIYLGAILLLGAMICTVILEIIKNRSK